MATVRDLLNALQTLAPAEWAFSWDKVGLQVGDPEAEVRRVAVSLDRSAGAVAFAANQGCQALVSHHPLLFDPLPAVTPDTMEGRTVIELLRHGIAFIAAHTNWDVAPGGINDTLAATLGLSEVQTFGSSAKGSFSKLVFFCPEDEVDKLVDVCGEAGAGVIGDYRRCAFCSDGVGTYEAGPNAKPSIGKPGERSIVGEVRVEMLCSREVQAQVDRALRAAHTYEEPAIDFCTLTDSSLQRIGRMGNLAKPMPLDRFEKFLEKTLETKCTTWGDTDHQVQKVAVVGGGADSEWLSAKAAGADVMVTGEVKQHIALEAAATGLAIIAAGHYATEQPGCFELSKRLRAASCLEVLDFVPSPGEHGRPI